MISAAIQMRQLAHVDGRAYAHRIRLAMLKCMSTGSRRNSQMFLLSAQ